MVHIWNTDAFGKIPLLRIADADFFAILGRNLGSQFIGADVTAHKQNFTIELQIADVRPLVMMNVVQIGRIRKIAVKGEIAGDLLVDRPVHQPADELVVVDKLNPLLVAVFLFDKAVELQRIMLTGGTNVVGNDIIMGNLVALLGVIPEVADVLDVLAVMVDQGVVDGDDALGTVTVSGHS